MTTINIKKIANKVDTQFCIINNSVISKATGKKSENDFETAITREYLRLIGEDYSYFADDSFDKLAYLDSLVGEVRNMLKR